MRNYIIRRFLLMIPTVLISATIVFFIIRLVPGDVVDMMIEYSEWLTVEQRQAIVAELGLDVPVHIQYGRWMGFLRSSDGSFNGLFQGNLGTSWWTNRPVTEDLLERWPVTVELGIIAFVSAQLAAFPLGIYSALRQDTAGDYIARSFAILCISIPAFWLGTLIIVLPAIWWDYMPPIKYISLTEDPIGNLRMMIVPGVILGMFMSGQAMRMVRSMMLEVLRQDYIRTAWAKGLKERVVVVRHALKNALIPVITIGGFQAMVMVGGSVVIEQIFMLPGLGRLVVVATGRRDYPTLVGVLLLFVVALLIINLIVDLTYGFLDPRIRYQ